MKKTRFASNLGSYLFWMVFGLVIAFMIFSSLYSRKVTLTATGFHWERKINTETWRTIQEEGWEIPQGGRETRSWLSYDFWKKKFRTRYAYEIERWVPEQHLFTSGNDRKPYWPLLTLASNEHESGRAAEYQIFFRGENGKTYQKQCKETEWQKIDDQSFCFAQVGLFGDVREIVLAENSENLAAH